MPLMTSVTGTTVVHPVIVTADLPRAIDYYRDVLSLVPGAAMEHDSQRLGRLTGLPQPIAMAVVLTAPGGGEIELVQFRSPVGRPTTQGHWPDAGIRSVTFKMDNLDDTLRRARASQHAALGEIVQFPGPDGDVRVVYVGAPDGVIVTLMEEKAALPPHAQPPIGADSGEPA